MDQFDKKDKAPKAITTLPSDKNATYSGKNATIALRGLVINVNKNPFDDFPEVIFFFFFFFFFFFPFSKINLSSNC